MIYSASRRTDMVAFCPGAICGRVQRSRKLDAIVFWTKDPRNLILHPGLRRVVSLVPSIIQLTVTGLAGSPWEPRVPPLADFTPHLAELAAILPKGAIQWRFDPLMPTDDWQSRFAGTKAALDAAIGGVDGVTTSFPDPYRKAVARSNQAGLTWPKITLDEKKRMVEYMAAQTPVRLCCEPELLDLPGVSQSRCIDGRLFHQLYGLDLADLPKDKGQRLPCGCVTSTDIGSYAQRCPHRCLYCYANPDHEEGQVSP